MKNKLHPKYDSVVCETRDLRPVWAKVNSMGWGVEYEPYLVLCKTHCPCCGSELDYGLGKNNHGKPDYATPSTDHIIPQSYGGENSIENFWIICERCNRFKNNATYDDVERIRKIAQVLEETKQRSKNA